MTPGALLDLLAGRQIRLFVADGRFKFQAPVGAYTERLRVLVAQYRYEFLDHWRCLECGNIVSVLYGIDDIRRCKQCHLGGEKG